MKITVPVTSLSACQTTYWSGFSHQAAGRKRILSPSSGT